VRAGKRQTGGTSSKWFGSFMESTVMGLSQP
jgi:hypothetical protein